MIPKDHPVLEELSTSELNRVFGLIGMCDELECGFELEKVEDGNIKWELRSRSDLPEWFLQDFEHYVAAIYDIFERGW